MTVQLGHCHLLNVHKGLIPSTVHALVLGKNQVSFVVSMQCTVATLAKTSHPTMYFMKEIFRMCNHTQTPSVFVVCLLLELETLSLEVLFH